MILVIGSEEARGITTASSPSFGVWREIIVNERRLMARKYIK